MKNTEIKYDNLSTDYRSLYKEVLNGNKLVGFSAVSFQSGDDYHRSSTHSKIVEISYDEKFEQFNIGNTTFFKDTFQKVENFIDICEHENVRYFKL